MQSVINFYQHYDEEARFTTDKARKVEFIITTRTLEKFIKPSDTILELGAGTGAYSVYFAEKGNKVVATDITPKHVEAIQHKLQQREEGSLNLEAKWANATDLHEFASGSFDVVLCLGPMYHLTGEADRVKCIQESLRVLKKGGLLVIAYINKHYILHSVMSNDKEFLNKPFIDKILTSGVTREGEAECFWTDTFFTTPDEITKFIEPFDVRIIDHLASDGLSPFLKALVNEFTDEELETWLYYIENSCREKSILGMSNHAMLLCEKV